MDPRTLSLKPNRFRMWGDLWVSSSGKPGNELKPVVLFLDTTPTETAHGVVDADEPVLHQRQQGSKIESMANLIEKVSLSESARFFPGESWLVHCASCALSC
jgi:hypothetical protein